MRELDIFIKRLYFSFLKMCLWTYNGAIFCTHLRGPSVLSFPIWVVFFNICYDWQWCWGPHSKQHTAFPSLLWILEALKVRKILSGLGHNKRPYWMLFSWACKFSEVCCSDLESTDYALWFKTLKKQSVWAAVKFLQNKQTHKLALYNLLILHYFPLVVSLQEYSGKMMQNAD